MITKLKRHTADETTFLKCLKTWRDQVHPHKRKWLETMADKVTVLLAKNDAGETVGMLQLIPIEDSNCHGENLAFIQCLLVNFYDKGVGNQHGKGYGKALVEEAIRVAMNQGKDGIAAWGTEFNGMETVDWYVRQSFQKVQLLDYTGLVFMPFKADVAPPKFVDRKPIPLTKGKVTVSVFNNGWCTSSNILSEMAIKAAKEFPEVNLKVYDTFNREIFLSRGIMEGVFVENDQIIYFGEPFDEKVTKSIRTHLDNL